MPCLRRVHYLLPPRAESVTLLREDREWWFPGQFNAIHIRATSCRTPIAIPPENLDEASAPASEEKQGARKGILTNQRLNKRKQSIEAAPHIDGFRADEDLY